MSVILRHSRFLHIPKCGGMWVRGALNNFCRGAQNFDPPHTTYNEAPHPELPTFCTLRPPDEWFLSYYAFRENSHWPGNHLDKYRADTFQKFMTNILDSEPDHFDNYCRTRIRPDVLVLKMCNIRQSLPRLLAFLREEFNRTGIVNKPVSGANNYDRPDYVWDEGQRREVLDCNPWVQEIYESAW